MAVLTEAIEAEGEAAAATATGAVVAMTIAPAVVTTTAAVAVLARDHAPLMMTADTIAPMAAAPDGMTVMMIALLDENARADGAAVAQNVPVRLLRKS
jgi:hypothetical protein